MNNGKICIPVCAETADEMIANVRRAEKLADIIEVRFDCLPASEISNFKSEISSLEFRKPLLATFRSPEQGGFGSATLPDREIFWQALGNDFLFSDHEEDVFDSVPSSKDRLISHHDFTGVPDDLDAIFEQLMDAGADVVKLAVRADDVVDAIPLWKLLEQSNATGKRIVPIAMGDAGKWTRILGLAHGAFLTYASLNVGNETADGQITAMDMRDVYRVKELDADTRVFGVVGYPASSSMSPYMHNPAFAATGENAVFLPLQVNNLDEFMWRMVRKESREVELNFAGFSVTMPHKQSIMRHLDEIDPVAERIGAVNTVKIDGERLTGFNTDAHGFITPLKSRFGDLKNSRAAVFGAGGAARAVVHALKKNGVDVSVFVRDRERASRFSEEMSVPVEDAGYSSVAREQLQVNRFDIVVNATPLGMKGQFEKESLLSADELSGVKFVYDLVTSPTDTPLVAEAKKAGIPAIGGIEMLLAQGAKQFEIWTGREAPVDIMRAALTARLGG